LSLSSTSTDAQVWAAFDDNASFEEDHSTAKATSFVTACRILLRRRPISIATDGTQVQFDAAVIDRELQRARTWLQANSAATGPRYADLSGIRD
jgi:hypothetical protein